MENKTGILLTTSSSVFATKDGSPYTETKYLTKEDAIYACVL